ncbi:Hypothetical predicted protein [Olea europaea subsp. europaea]|uniref:Uncharacterized protein n=1 Tax=Olea europaea subsp. europaea TaxID=158383 RepID=A0A8S0SRK6_OLEEU|nr:Hypothetical predicted protein [Olea europaea subsp. europaea]
MKKLLRPTLLESEMMAVLAAIASSALTIDVAAANGSIVIWWQPTSATSICGDRGFCMVWRRCLYGGGVAVVAVVIQRGGYGLFEVLRQWQQ